MDEWKPREKMGPIGRLRFALGGWAVVETLPEWVHNVYDPPDAADVLPNHGVESVFTGHELEFKIETRRRTEESGTYVERTYYARKR